MLSSNQEQFSGAKAARDRIDFMAASFAFVAFGIAVLGIASPVFPWWSGEWNWWGWDISGLRQTSNHLFGGIAVMVFSFLGWVCACIAFVQAIVGVTARSLVVPRLILFTGAIVTVVSFLDLASTLSTDWWTANFGLLLALGSGLGLVLVSTGMIIAFSAAFDRNKEHDYKEKSLAGDDSGHLEI